VYAPEKFEYAINRFTMEAKRQLDVLDRRLAESRYLGGDEYSIADIAVWPWYGQLVRGNLYGAAGSLRYTNTPTCNAGPKPSRNARPYSVARVNRTWGDEASQVPERHSAADLG
jgi:GST-like protein